MKKSVFLLLCFIFSLFPIFPASHTAFSASPYMRVIDTKTPFYSDREKSTLLFYLPYTYYVKLLSDSDVCHIAIETDSGLTLDGYTDKDKLFFDGLSVSSPYTNKTLTTVKSTVFYADKELLNPIQYVFEGRNLVLYGEIEGKEKLYYVFYNDNFGYVKESSVFPFSVENHPNPLTFIQEEVKEVFNESPASNPDPTLFTLRIIIVISLALAGTVALVFAVKNKPKRKEYYEEDE